MKINYSGKKLWLKD